MHYLLTKRIDFYVPLPILHQALQIALYDEYRAQATYQSVLDAFGNVAPFNQIVQAETRHIAALLPLLQRYQVTIPANNWYRNVVPAQLLVENCKLGVVAEIQNVQMYDHLLAHVTQSDIRQTFNNLRTASLHSHLPAFRHYVHYYNQSITFPRPTATTLPWLWKLSGLIMAKLLLLFHF